MHVRPAATPFTENGPNHGKLRIANTDYWAFDAKAGEVLTLNTKSSDFRHMMIVSGPNMEEIRHFEAGVDQTSDNWRLVVWEPGRYLVHISCVGNGGGGEYSLSRTVLRPKEFEIGNPAQADISRGQVQIWKFTVKKGEPMLLHWSSSAWHYEVESFDESGHPKDFQRDDVDEHTKYGILRTPGTYLIVLSGNGAKSTYSIDLSPIPGYKKPGG